MLSPADKARQCQIAKTVYLDLVGADLVCRQFAWLVEDNTGRTAKVVIGALKETVQPRDVIEEMLVLQMAWTHARLARLSRLANNQTDRNGLRVVNDACDRAANTYRRQMLALAEYRRPPREPFVAVKQDNIAQQQVVQNAEIRKIESGNGSNEQGSAAPKTLPPHAEGADFIAAGRAEPQTVAVEHRAADGRGQGPVKNERDETR